MLCVRAPLLERRLVRLAKKTGKTKSYFVRTALELFLHVQCDNDDELDEEEDLSFLTMFRKKRTWNDIHKI